MKKSKFSLGAVFLLGFLLRISAQVSGNKNEASSGTEIFCDAFEYYEGAMTGSASSQKIDSDSYSVYPNPSHREFTIESSQAEAVKISIYDLQGRMVYNNTFRNKIQISRDRILGSGVFLIKLTTKNGTFTERIVVE
ncbi:T9SS type A sorting domain-containing protein [Portibacter lacus]|uniref:Secretion system C-terminal sorting domain-containing protein n=1 Tax=Portibacter lacus TaxID=1099794 RepID=A0AA37SN48_9BACT|nr:T9SS type A sorting domain-containing protein [Portibacter lacus]GLR17858.1 hypothetical protein GCM10007940_24730 [Portibacter lacus]